MKTEELIKELKLSIHEGITALDPLAKELLREYKMQQLVYAIISGMLVIIFGFIAYKLVKKFIVDEDYDESAIEFVSLILTPIILLTSFVCMVISIINYVSPILSLMQSLTGNWYLISWHFEKVKKLTRLINKYLTDTVFRVIIILEEKKHGYKFRSNKARN